MGVKYPKKPFVPLREFRDLADANPPLRDRVMQQASMRARGTAHEQPLARFAVEKLPLTALPDVPPVLAAWNKVKVHADWAFRLREGVVLGAVTLASKDLWLKATDTTVQLLHRYELVATHPRCASTVIARLCAIISFLKRGCDSSTICSGAWLVQRKSGRHATR